MPEPRISKDGRFWWDGDKWVPFAPKAPKPLSGADTSKAVTRGVLDAVGLMILIPLAILVVAVVILFVVTLLQR